MKAIPLSRRFDLLSARLDNTDDKVSLANGLAITAIILATISMGVSVWLLSTVWTMPC